MASNGKIGTSSSRRRIRKPQAGTGFRAAEFFAGVGLVRLALERQGWRVRFANDLDPAKAEMYQHNWPKDDHLRVENIHQPQAEWDMRLARFA